MTTNKDKLDRVIYTYTADVSSLEEENRLLRETVSNLKAEVDRFRRNPLMICEIKEITGKNAIIKIPNGSEFFVDVSQDCKGLKAGDTVLVEQKNLTVIKKIASSKRFNVDSLVIIEKPHIKWSQIGGLEEQIKEVKEVIELPLKRPELFKKIGIQPPKGILLHGPPGTGKTLLAKAVASSTNATFIEIVGSELVQKFIGEGAKLVKEIFEMAREKAPSIVFIDELDALAAKRIDIGTSGEREVQRTFMQLLSELDGFRHLGNVKIIGCTNRRDILDPAILRPGRLDRQIKVPVPTSEGIREIFKIHTQTMKLKAVKMESVISAMEGFSGAEIRSVCTEAGYFAIRKKRGYITTRDLLTAVDKIREKEESDDFKGMFG
ncbi:AAA family ATPase [Candidatus Woesearchaeota archaeon]|nr:AAA family ATPase [Candidatus Woesearchaeota archaeon]